MSLGGWIKYYRKVMESAVWSLPPGQHKVWDAILLLANNTDRKWWDGREEVEIRKGSFVTSLDKLAEAAKVSRKVVRGALTNLERIGSIRAHRRAHKFTLIEVVNFDAYQGGEGVEGTVEGTLRAHRGHTEGTNVRMKEGEKERKDPLAFNKQSFWEKFSHQDQEVIHQTIQAIHSSRKRGKVADSIIQAELRWWDQQNPAQVIQGMRTYLEKGYAAQGKREKYLQGIIRNSDEQSVGSSPAVGKGHSAIQRAAMNMTREDCGE